MSYRIFLAGASVGFDTAPAERHPKRIVAAETSLGIDARALEAS